jgi:hypothetical protein
VQLALARQDEKEHGHPDAAGIDVGASELFVAVSADRDPEPVRSFPTITRDLNAPADWLRHVAGNSGKAPLTGFHPTLKRFPLPIL